MWNNIPVIGSEILLDDDRCVVNRLLGKGSYGSVYLLEIDGKYEAAKVINEPDNEGVTSIIEIDVMSKFRHPNIANVNGMYWINGALWLRMKYAKCNLRNYMLSSKLSMNKKIKIMHDLAMGLSFLHGNGVLHLDIKPANVLIYGDINPRAALTDFGISLFCNGESKFFPSQLTTITYRAPEVINGCLKYKKSSDIWSLGMLYLTLLTDGKSIFKKSTKYHIKTVISKHLNSNVLNDNLMFWFSCVPKKYRELAVDLVSKMLCVNPDDRWDINTIIKHPIFNNKNNKIGLVIQPKCEEIKVMDWRYYLAFDWLYFICDKMQNTVETTFLACDLFHRILPHLLANTTDIPLHDIYYTMITCYAISLKCIESIKPNYKMIVDLDIPKKTNGHFIDEEFKIIKMLKGIIYRKNIFNISKNLNELHKLFEYTHNIYLYKYIYISGIKDDQMPMGDKSQSFRIFFRNTSYYKKYNNLSREERARKIYSTDRDIVFSV